MDETKKVLQMTFATAEGGRMNISLSNTKDNLTAGQVKEVMDTIVTSQAFETRKGSVNEKVRARFVTQTIEDLDIA